MEREGFLR